MQLFIFLVILVISLAFSTGCSTENPFCTDNYCIEGEIYPRSDLPSDEKVSDLAIHSPFIYDFLNDSIPNPPALGTPQTVADIVSHAALGGRDCIGNTYTLTGTVEFHLDHSLTLVTDHESILFFVTAFDNPESLAGYVEGETYTFTLNIREIKRNIYDRGDIDIWSNKTDA